jgi:membrane fusion protein (multidrug efflux system)
MSNATPTAPTAQPTKDATPAQPETRKKALMAVAAVVVLAGLGYGAYEYIVGSHYESTDNAYVQGNLVQITPQISGTVLSIMADDTDYVKAGQPLVKLDPSDAQVALEQAEAQLAQTVREVRGLYANNSTLKAQIALREADVARARSDVLRAEDDVNRRRPLLASGAVGKEEFSHATAELAAQKSALAAAQSAASAAREQLASSQVMTDGTSVEQHPNVQRAAAQVREAQLALRRVELPAPVDGYIAKRSVQLGQRVQAGAPLMSLIPLSRVWVDANFKEGQLRTLRIGQPVTLEADVYGNKVEYNGRVEGLSAGTGSAFSLLPAQNATGNWIKVVQRVPVRIALDPKQLVQHPLRVGLSMEATVDVHDQNGKTLADVPSQSASTQTAAFDDIDKEGEALVQRIIAANLGHPASKSVAQRGSAAEQARRLGSGGSTAGRSASVAAAAPAHAGLAVR